MAPMCLPEAPDCEDTVTEPAGGETGDAAQDSTVDEGALIREAEAMLGTPEADLDPDVRIGRRGDEGYALTEDYRIGRFTVELDDLGDGFVVTRVVVELTEGPYTVE